VTNSASITVEFTKRRELIRMRAEIDRLREENERLSLLAYRDPLTGLRNRRCFGERLGEEISRLKRTKAGAISLVLVDVNGFKALNDTLGHAAGDRALQGVASALESLVRAEDLVCRVGGDEFVLLLPDTDLEQASKVVERLRAHAPSLTGFGLGPRPLALGVGTWREGDDELTLLSRADAAMYADKRSSRPSVAEEPLARAA
jgi:diguanylate cyclase (GGDEF)-like protein